MPLQPPSAAANDVTTPSPLQTPKPKKRKTSEDLFENKLITRFDELKRGRQEPDACDAFGQDVARGCRAIADEYQREVTFRQIRDVLFHSKFNLPPPDTHVRTFHQMD